MEGLVGAELLPHISKFNCKRMKFYIVNIHQNTDGSPGE